MHYVESSKTQRLIGQGYTPSEVRSGLWHCMIAWLFGAGFFSIIGGAAFTSFLTKYLHTDDTTYGYINAVGSIGVIFLLLGSYTVERTGRSKRNFLVLVTLHRLLWLAVAAIPLLMPVRAGASTRPQVLLVCAIVLLSTVAANYGGAGWTAWMSGMVPKSLAGKFFGYRARLGMLSMIITAWGVSYALDRYEGSGAMYALVFAIAAVMGATDILLFIRVREVPQPVEDDPPTLLDIFTTPWRNALFRRFSLYTIVTWVAYMMMGPFVWRFCFDSLAAHGLQMSTSRANMLLFIIPMIVMAWVAPSWGKTIDRFGAKSVLAVCSLGSIIIPCGWFFVRPSTVWIIPIVSVLGALTWPGIDQVTFYMQLKGFPEQRRTAYIAMFLVIFGLASMGGTILGGYYASFWQHHLHHLPGIPSWISHYQPVFLTSILIRVLAFIFLLPRLPLPDADPKHALRSMAEEVYTAIPGVAALRRWWPR